MKPVFALQVTNRDDEDLWQTAKAINDAGYKWINFGIVPFENSVTNVEEFPTDCPVIVIGGIAALSLFQRNKLPSNWHMFYSYWLFDQCSTQTSPLQQFMVNRDPMFYTFDDVRDRTFASDMFVKPSSDMKAFAGLVLPKGTTLDQHLETITHMEVRSSEIIMVSKPVRLGHEYRLFIVNNKLVDGSQYRSPHRVDHKPISMDKAAELKDFFTKVQPYIESAPPSWTYGMDVAETENGLAIVEFNCFNCCGMYKADRALVFSELGAVIETGLWV